MILQMNIDQHGQTALHWSASNNDLHSTAFLIEQMTKEELALANYDNGYTALHLAAQNGNADMVRLLLMKGGHDLAKIADKFGQTALHWAAGKGALIACQIIIGFMSNEDVVKKTLKGETALDFALLTRFEDIINLLKTRDEKQEKLD